MPRGAKTRMRRTETPKPIWIIFCTTVDTLDVVTYPNFGDHRLRAFWVAGGQISLYPIDFHRRPYNTLALPCERVIGIPSPTHSFTLGLIRSFSANPFYRNRSLFSPSGFTIMAFPHCLLLLLSISVFFTF